MTTEHDCSACSSGCAARHTGEKAEEEIAAGPYLLFCAVLIVALAALFKWLF